MPQGRYTHATRFYNVAAVVAPSPFAHCRLPMRFPPIRAVHSSVFTLLAVVDAVNVPQTGRLPSRNCDMQHAPLTSPSVLLPPRTSPEGVWQALSEAQPGHPRV